MNALQIMLPRTNKINWTKIETERFKLPLLFKTFHDNFEISSIGNYFSFAYSKDNSIETFGYYTHPIIKNITLDTIFKLDDLENQLQELIEHEKANDIEPCAEKIIPIAYDSNGALLMLGVGEDNADKIYYYVRHWDERLKLIANNIFEFFKDYHIEIDEAYLRGVTLDKLYKNWGDKFWRVREENNENKPS